MNWARIMVFVMMAESVVASIGYFVAGDWRRGLYWAAASVISFSLTV